jgi:hypothetical protein
MAGVSANNGFLTGSTGVGPIKGRAPEFFLWFNPFAAQYDVICGASDGYGGWCSRLNAVTNGAISVSGVGGGLITQPTPAFGVDDSGGGFVAPGAGLAIPPDKAAALGIGGFAADPQPFGIRRDTFWPRSLQAWTVLSLFFILASIQLVSPTRRWRLLRRPARRFA